MKKKDDMIIKGTIAFPSIFEATIPEVDGQKLSDKATYSCVLNIDAETCKNLKASLTEAGFDKTHIDEVIKEYVPKTEEGEEAKEVADKDKKFFIRTSSAFKPTVYLLADKVNEKIDIKNGSEVRLKVAVREWTYLKKSGIKFYLNAVQILRLAKTDDFDDDFDLSEYEQDLED